jgi:hypothetical protein
MTSTSSSTIVQRLCNYCNVLRDDGMSYGYYVEQLTYRLFLKMDYENSSMLGKAAPSCLPHFQERKMGEEIAARLRQAVLKAAFEGRLG